MEDFLFQFVALSFTPVLPIMLLISESPKWLIATGKRDETKKVILRIMKINGIEKEPIIRDSKPSDKDSGGNFLDLFRTKMIRRNTIVISLAW